MGEKGGKGVSDRETCMQRPGVCDQIAGAEDVGRGSQKRRAAKLKSMLIHFMC